MVDRSRFRHRGQEVSAVARRLQRQHHLQIGLAGQHPVAVPGAGQPRPQHRAALTWCGARKQPQQRVHRSHSGDSAKRLIVRSSLRTSIRNAMTAPRTFRPVTKEYPSGTARPRRWRLWQLRQPGPPATQPATTEPAPRTTYRSVFAAGEFRVLFAGMLMYVLGFEFEDCSASRCWSTPRPGPRFLAALAFSMGFAPQAIGGALFTSLADRLPPRGVIAAGLLLHPRGTGPGDRAAAGPAGPRDAGPGRERHGAGTAAPVFSAAVFSGLLPDVLAGDRYILGRSVFSLTSSGAQIAGLGIAGAVLAALPARSLLLAAGGSLVVAALIMRLGLRPRPARAGSATVEGTVEGPVTGN